MTYDVFISYSHRADSHLAAALQTGLQTLARPWYRRRALHVFRDQTDLSVTPHLWPTIQAALGDSEVLLLMASPNAARSKWVAREVEHWFALGRPISSFILVVTGGKVHWDDERGDFDWTLSDAVPPVLRGRYTSEPKYVDLRPFEGDYDVSLSNEAFAQAIAPIAAHLHGKTVGELFTEEARQHQRMIRARNAVIALLTALLVATLLASVLAWRSQQRAVAAREEALRSARASQARALAAQSVTSRLAGRPHQATLLGLEAIAIHTAIGDPPLLQARAALYGALGELDGVGVGSHAAAGTAIAMSHDGRRLATGDADGEVRIWDLDGQRHRLVSEHRVHTLPVADLAFDLSGTLITAGRDRRVYRLDLDGTGTPELVAEAPGRIESLEVDTKGRVLFASSDGTARLIPGSVIPVGENPMAATLHPGGRWLAVPGADGVLRIADLDDPAGELREIDRHESGLLLARFSPDGRWLVACGLKPHCTLVESASLAHEQPTIRRLQGHEHSIFDATFSSGSALLATASDDGRVGVWLADQPTSPPVFSSCTGDNVKEVAFSDDASVLFARAGRSVCAWELHTDTSAGLEVRDARLMTGHDDDVLGLAVLERTAYTIGRDGLVFAWMPARPGFSDPIGAHSDQLVAIEISESAVMTADRSGSVCVSPSTGAAGAACFRPDAKAGMATQFALAPEHELVAAGTRTGYLRLCVGDAVNGPCPALFRHPAPVTAIAIDTKALRLASGDAKGRLALHMLDLTGPEPSLGLSEELPGHSVHVTALTFDPTGNLLLSGDVEGGMRLAARGPDGWRSRELRGHEEIVRGATFSTNSGLFVTYGTDAWAIVWEVDAQGEPTARARLEGHVQEPLPLGIQTVLLSPDATMAITAGADATVRVWDLSAEDPSAGHRVLHGHGQGTFGHGVKSLALTADGHWLASGGEDGVIRLWDLTTENPGQEAVEVGRHAAAVTLVRFDGLEEYVLSGGDGGVVRRWPFELSEIRRAACDGLARDFSESEAATFLGTERNLGVCEGPPW